MEEGGEIRGFEERIFLISKLRGQIRGKEVFLIDNLFSTGKMFLHWFDGNQFLNFLQEEWLLR